MASKNPYSTSKGGSPWSCSKAYGKSKKKGKSHNSKKSY